MRYEESFKQHCVNLVVKEGRIKASVTKEFNLSQGVLLQSLKNKLNLEKISKLQNYKD